MAVAKSYETMEQVGEPFLDNGKMYVKLFGKCPRCGGSGRYSWNSMDGDKCYGCMGSGRKTITVRWYTDAERARQDRAAEKRAEAKAVREEAKRVKFAARNAFGFGDAGYITLYKGDPEEISKYFKSFAIDEAGHRAAWFNTTFKWYTPSKMEVPADLPEGIEAIRLNWEDVRDVNDEENLAMADTETVEAYVNALIAIPSASEYQGAVGDWITKSIVVKKNITLDGRFGRSHMHVMEDEAKNVYVWTTASKSVEAGTVMTLKMKVKEHKDYNGVHQTVVYYCKEA